MAEHSSGPLIDVSLQAGMIEDLWGYKSCRGRQLKGMALSILKQPGNCLAVSEYNPQPPRFLRVATIERNRNTYIL